MARSTHYSSLARPDLLLIKYRFHIHYLEKYLRKLRQNFDRDPTIGLKVMSRLTYSLAWRDQTSSSPTIDSTHPLYGEKASGNSSKISIEIKRSDQKLLPLRNVTLAWRDQTSSSQSIDSTSTIWKSAFEN
jgi:hypothetical protein